MNRQNIWMRHKTLMFKTVYFFILVSLQFPRPNKLCGKYTTKLLRAVIIVCNYYVNDYDCSCLGSVDVLFVTPCMISQQTNK